jgi:hypothetical protein
MPTTPGRAYPYPDPTDPVSAGASDIRALAERLDQDIGYQLGVLYAAFNALLNPGRAHTSLGAVVFGGADANRRLYTPPTQTVDVDQGGYFQGAGLPLYVGAPVAGIYCVLATLDEVTIAGSFGLGLVLNDAAIAGPLLTATIPLGAEADGKGGLQTLGLHSLAAGDTLKATAWSTGGGAARLTLEVFRVDVSQGFRDLTKPSPPPEVAPRGFSSGGTG